MSMIGESSMRNIWLLYLIYLGLGLTAYMPTFTYFYPERYRCRTDCDGEEFDWEVPGHEPDQIFPSLDSNSSLYDPNYPNYCQHYRAVPIGESCYFDRDQIVSCQIEDDFAYESLIMDSTVSTEFNLVCSKYYKKVLGDLYFTCGHLLGIIVVSVMADKLDRGMTLLFALIICSFGNFLCCAMPTFTSFSFVRMFTGAGLRGASLVAFLMVLESIPARLAERTVFSSRIFIGCWTDLPFLVGGALPPLFAYGLKNWKIYQAVVSSVIALTSLSWLGLSKAEKKQEARTDEDTPGRGLLRRGQFVIFLVLLTCWVTITWLSYGLALETDKIHLTNNVYLVYTIIPLIQLPVTLLVPFLPDILGRRWLFALAQVIPGILCAVLGFLEPGTAVYTILGLLGKGMAGAAVNLVAIYTVELFPSPVRARVYGFMTFVSLLAGFISPIIGKFQPEFTGGIVFGLIGVFGGLISLVLPEPGSSTLPGSYRDVEDIRRKTRN